MAPCTGDTTVSIGYNILIPKLRSIPGVRDRSRAERHQGSAARKKAHLSAACRLVGVSEATIKRDLSRGTFSLPRLDQICAALDLTLQELTQVNAGAELVTQLSEAQETALVSNPKILSRDLSHRE